MHIVTSSLQCAQVSCKKCCLVFQERKKINIKLPHTIALPEEQKSKIDQKLPNSLFV